MNHTYVWAEDFGAPREEKPVRNMEDELVGELVIRGRVFKRKCTQPCVFCRLPTVNADADCSRGECIRSRR